LLRLAQDMEHELDGGMVEGINGAEQAVRGQLRELCKVIHRFGISESDAPLEPGMEPAEIQTDISMQSARDASQGMSLNDRMEFGGVASAAVQAVIEQADVAAECRPETEDAMEQCTPCGINVASQCTPERNTVDVAQGMSLSDRIDSGGVADVGAQSVNHQVDAALQCILKPAIKSAYIQTDTAMIKEADVPAKRKLETEDAAKQRTPRASKAALECTPERSAVDALQSMSFTSSASFVSNQSVMSKWDEKQKVTSLKRLMEAKPRYRNTQKPRYRNTQLTPTKDVDNGFDSPLREKTL